MSNIYIKEPPTSGKVLLETTAGDIDIELWCRECPKACRNFIQLCLENYYDNTVFHRLVPNFLVQGGDPTGSGDGGESVYGKPFKDEFHTRLKFERRGLVGMASVEPNSNTSQFFFTLSATPELTGKNTLFGKVEGNTLYNMLALGDMGADEDGRPNKKHRIIRTEVLNNPFDDIEPRQIARAPAVKHKPEENSKQKDERVPVKNYSLLSFGDEAEEDEIENEEVITSHFKGRSKSAHDRLKNDPKLLSQSLQCEEKPANEKNGVERSRKKRHERDSDESSSDDVIEKSKSGTKKSRRADDDSSDDEDAGQLIAKEEKLRQMREEADKMLAELNMKKLQKLSSANVTKATVTKTNEVDKREQDMYSTSYMKNYRHLKSATAKTPSEKAAKQDQTMKMLADFESKLKAANQLNFASNYDDDEEEDEQNGIDVETTNAETKQNLDSASWMTHKFQVDDSALKQARDANVERGDDEYEIFDPRNPMNKRRREKAKQAMKDRRKPLAGVKDIG